MPTVTTPAETVVNLLSNLRHLCDYALIDFGAAGQSKEVGENRVKRQPLQPLHEIAEAPAKKVHEARALPGKRKNECSKTVTTLSEALL